MSSNVRRYTTVMTIKAIMTQYEKTTSDYGIVVTFHEILIKVEEESHLRNRFNIMGRRELVT